MPDFESNNIDVICLFLIGSCTWKYIHDVWESTFSLMLTHITTLHQARLKELLPVMVNYWTNITGIPPWILNKHYSVQSETGSNLSVYIVYQWLERPH